MPLPPLTLEVLGEYSRITFIAMASPCEILVRNLDKRTCEKIGMLAWQETKRIENKFSRYLLGNSVSLMNTSAGKKVAIDSEIYQLLKYAGDLFEMSDGLFDITSGVLRKVWTFTERSTPPSNEQILNHLHLIGFDKLEFNRDFFTMPQGMELDFGGIGKEYAVDRVGFLLSDYCAPYNASFLVNFGGDITAYQLAPKDPVWRIGLVAEEVLDQALISISHGSVATSGNTSKFVNYKGKRFGHLLNPKTGYPIEGAPLTATAFADSCVMAGSLSSLTMLQGRWAEKFLKEQSIKGFCHW